MLPWLSGNSAGTLREGRPALLCLVLGCNLKACKVLCGHWRTHGFSPLDILPVVSFYIACVHLGPSGCWSVSPAQPVFCADRSPRCLLQPTSIMQFPENPMSEGRASPPLTSPQKGGYTGETMTFLPFVFSF